MSTRSTRMFWTQLTKAADLRKFLSSSIRTAGIWIRKPLSKKTRLKKKTDHSAASDWKSVSKAKILLSEASLRKVRHHAKILKKMTLFRRFAKVRIFVLR